MIDFEGQFISCNEVARIKSITQKSLFDLCRALGVSLYQLGQVSLFMRNMMWLERESVSLLGIKNYTHLMAA